MAMFDLLDGEEAVRRADAHVASGDEIDAAADAAALHHRDHRDAAAVDDGKAVLHVLDVAAESLARSSRIAGRSTQRRAGPGEVEPGSEVLAGRGDNYGADAWVGVDRLETLDDLGPERLVHGIEGLWADHRPPSATPSAVSRRKGPSVPSSRLLG